MAIPLPDSLGRYPLALMEDRVRRSLNDVQLTVDQTDGAEDTGVAPVYPTQLYSNTDIDAALNKSMIDAFLEMSADHDDLFAQISYITIASGVQDYALPIGILQLRTLRIKPDSVTLANVQPDMWRMMVYYDEDMSQGIQHQFGGPTYRRIGDNIRLGWVPWATNSSGIMVDSVVLPPELINPTDVVRSQFARLMQNFMIYDAAVNIGETREIEIPDELKNQRDRSHEILTIAVNNALKPPSVQLYSTRLPKNTYSGRWHG